MSLKQAIVRSGRCKGPVRQRWPKPFGLGKLNIEFRNRRLSVVATILALALHAERLAWRVGWRTEHVHAMLSLTAAAMLLGKRGAPERRKQGACQVLELFPRFGWRDLLVDKVHRHRTILQFSDTVSACSRFLKRAFAYRVISTTGSKRVVSIIQRPDWRMAAIAVSAPIS